MLSGAEDVEDTEYNYLADQAEEEKEEFRDDRAVRISSEWWVWFGRRSFMATGLSVSWEEEFYDDRAVAIVSWCVCVVGGSAVRTFSVTSGWRDYSGLYWELE